MENKVELSDDELNNITGGLDFDMISIDNVSKLAKAIFIGDINTAQSLISKFLSAGVNPNVIERFIDRCANSDAGKALLKNVLETIM